MPLSRKLRNFNTKLLRERDKLEKRGVRMAHAALARQYRSFAEKLALSFNMDDFERLAESITSEEIEKFMLKYYGMFAPISLMYRNNAISQKSAITGIQYKAGEDEEYLSIFQQYLQGTLRGEAGEAIRTITGTSQDKIKGIIRNILADSELTGKGVEHVKRQIMKSVGENLRGNGWARARVIAQTELISASNMAADYAVQSTGFDNRKFWSTSHLEGVRTNHTLAEQESIQRGGLKPTELFQSTQMLYPGDPNGEASERINCRCSILYEIV